MNELTCMLSVHTFFQLFLKIGTFRYLRCTLPINQSRYNATKNESWGNVPITTTRDPVLYEHVPPGSLV